MAAFIVGKSMKDRRQTKAIEELFDHADKNGNGRISVQDYVSIFSEHGIRVDEEEIEKVTDEHKSCTVHGHRVDPDWGDGKIFDLKGGGLWG